MYRSICEEQKLFHSNYFKQCSVALMSGMTSARPAIPAARTEQSFDTEQAISNDWEFVSNPTQTASDTEGQWNTDPNGPTPSGKESNYRIANLSVQNVLKIVPARLFRGVSGMHRQ